MVARARDAERAAAVLRRLKRAYPDSTLALHFSSPFELLIALILAAQCTDDKVNQITASVVFPKYRTPQDFVRVSAEELERDIHSTGFFRQKTRSVQRCCAELIDRFGGQVPATLEELLTLPGVGRKTANILLGNAFGKPAIGVDTHVARLAQRLGFSRHTDPDKIEFDLNDLVPVRDRTRFCHVIQTHGRRVCFARKPNCPECVIADLCPYPDKTTAVARKPPRPAFGRRVRLSGRVR